jgi:copper(I)-binding protein
VTSFRRRFAALIVLLAGAFAPMAAGAHSAEVDGVKIGHAWAPPAKGEGAAVYMPILNDRDDAVSLVSASTPVAERVRLRETGNGEATFYSSLKLAPGQPVSLAEWRLHLWMDGLNRDLEVGDRFPLTVTFEPGGTVELEIYVEESPGH